MDGASAFYLTRHELLAVIMEHAASTTVDDTVPVVTEDLGRVLGTTFRVPLCRWSMWQHMGSYCR